MSRGGAPAFADQSALSLLLREPRYEVIPVQGIEQKVAAASVRRHRHRHRVTHAGPRPDARRERGPRRSRLPRGAALRGAHGHRAQPPGAARAAPGGDRASARCSWSAATPTRRRASTPTPATCSRSSRGWPIPFARIGIGGYPEGHPLDPATTGCSRRSCRKQPFASHLVTQLCFDADALAAWVARTSAPPASSCRWSSACPAWWSGASSPRSRCARASAPRSATCASTAGRSSRWRARGATTRPRSREAVADHAADASARHPRRAPLHLQPGGADAGLGRAADALGAALATPPAAAGERVTGPAVRLQLVLGRRRLPPAAATAPYRARTRAG